MAMKKQVKKETEGQEVTAIQKAAADVNEVLKPEPPLDITMADDALSNELKELIPSITEGDKLDSGTWDVLKSLGYKAPEAEKKPAAKKPAAKTGNKKMDKPTAKSGGEKKVSQSAMITAAVGTKTSVSRADLVKKTGLELSRINSHLSWMKRKNLWNGTIKD